jgi:hypothetical protein
MHIDESRGCDLHPKSSWADCRFGTRSTSCIAFRFEQTAPPSKRTTRNNKDGEECRIVTLNNKSNWGPDLLTEQAEIILFFYHPRHHVNCEGISEVEW